MGVRVTEWLCPTPECATKLANVAEANSGWIERKCHNCGKTAHLGTERRRGEAIIKLRCDSHGPHQHTIGEASADWRGTINLRCRKCKTETVIPRPM